MKKVQKIGEDSIVTVMHGGVFSDEKTGIINDSLQLYFYDQKKFHKISQEFLHLSSAEKRALKYQKLNVPSVLTDFNQKLYEKNKEKWLKNQSVPIAKRILECRKMIMLINSGGGEALIADSLVAIIERIKKNNGKIYALIGSHAMSAAANTAALADKIIAMDNSHFMWHISSESDFLDSEDEDTDMITELLLDKSNNASAIRKKIDTAINDVNNPRNTMYFTAQELKEYKFVDTVFESIENFKKKFCRLLSISKTKLMQSSIAAIYKRFYLLSDLERDIFNKFGIRIYIDPSPENGKLTIDTSENIDNATYEKIWEHMANWFIKNVKNA